MMEPVLRIDSESGNACDGQVQLSLPKAAWVLGMLLAALIICPLTYSNQALVLYLSTTYLSLLIGHSVGMHRMMIHRTFRAPKIFERALIYVGVLVGMAGPFGTIKIHDIRDWAQRQQTCHPFFAHEMPFFKDLWWQLTSVFVFTHPPTIDIESHVYDDTFYRFLERTWRWHQLLLAVVLYALGGWAFVAWGVCARVATSVIGHWTITYFCHNPGPGRWRVRDAGVQASNIPGLGVLTYGECWHNNHHAFPESARIGLEPGQCDPSWRFIQIMGLLGIASDIGQPRPENQREDLMLSD